MRLRPETVSSYSPNESGEVGRITWPPASVTPLTCNAPAMVVGGLGLAIQSLHVLTLEGVHGPVALLDVQGFPIPRQWYIVHPRNKELSLVAKAFLEFALSNGPNVTSFMNDLLRQAGFSCAEAKPRKKTRRAKKR